MERVLSYALSGLSTGTLYALVALGLVLVYRSTRVLNFAQGDLAAAGVFVAFALLGRGWGTAPALTAGVLAGALIAIAFHRGVLAPAQRRGANPLGQAILTIGLGQVIQGVVLNRWGAQPERFPLPLGEVAVESVGPAWLSPATLGTLAVGATVALVLYVLMQRTRLGLALRAASLNLEAAQTLGIPARRVLAFAWGLSAALGVVAGVFLASALLLDPFFMAEPFLKGFAAAVLGGLDSLPGALVGGLLLGLAEGLAAAWLPLGFKNVLAFAVIVAVLLVRPAGLLGREFKERV